MRSWFKPRYLLGLYVALLLASHGVRRWQTGTAPARPADRQEAELQAFAADGARPGRVLLRYGHWPITGHENGDKRQASRTRPTESSPAIGHRELDSSDAAVVVLLHGSPGSSRDFARLAPALAARGVRVLAPDLPGFGASTRRLPDFSVRAHARYTLALLDRLGIEQAHLLGFSMGGGVALEAAGLAPERVRSLTLLSSIGVQELELLGSHRLNHLVHGLQLTALWAVHELTPHFGRLDGAMLDVAYARNFFDTDQRRLRDLLAGLEIPTLILHGESDFLVPVAAAHEHHRIVPQSELEVLDGGHFLLFRRTAGLAEPIASFLQRVENGMAVERQAAEPSRLLEGAEPFDPASVPRAAGVALILLGTLLALATLASEDLTSIAAGLLVAQGRIGFAAASLACFAGIFVGDVALFWAGRALGRGALRRAPLAWLVSPERVEASSVWFRERGPAVIFLSRFLPGARLPTYFAAGLLDTPFRRFATYFAAAVALWTPLLVGAAALAGRQLFAYFALFERWALPGILGLAAALWLLTRLLPRLATARGRRLLVGGWRRWRQWEFWPVWLFYLPVVGWILWLGLRHRAPTLFTAANPGIPAGGVVGESKADILDQLPSEMVARYARIPAEPDGPTKRPTTATGTDGRTEARASPERLALARAFLAESPGAPPDGLPVVLKPDVGERGTGVVIAHTWQEVERVLASHQGALLIQEHVEGPELGVFYARRPGAERGELVSITEKLLPEVVGDGRSTVEELILADERAVILAETYLEALEASRRRVLAVGDRLRLTELGTHSRGAIFLDGSRFAGPELTDTIERTSRSFDGFFFGRFDLRAPGEEDLRAGRQLKILELNGVTSEATHLYDPRHSLVEAYRILFNQWRLAFEIGAANRQRGVETIGARELWQRWRAAR